MKAHISTLLPRVIRAGMRVHACRYRVVAVGIDYKDRIISLATNTPRLQNRGSHAEERVIFSSPKSLDRIIIVRIGARGNILPIDPL